MFDDQDLGFFANFLGIFIFVLVIAYHFVMAEPKYEGNQGVDPYVDAERFLDIPSSQVKHVYRRVYFSDIMLDYKNRSKYSDILLVFIVFTLQSYVKFEVTFRKTYISSSGIQNFLVRALNWIRVLCILQCVWHLGNEGAIILGTY